MSEVELGKLIDGVAFRDAIHVAVIPRNASEMLRPGQRVGLIGDTEAGPSDECIGIVDPYLTDVVPKGRAFWLCLLPNTVTGMRHHWEHPNFDVVSEDPKTKAKRELERISEYLGYDLDDLIGEGSELVTGDYILASESTRDDWYGVEDEFWRYLEIYRGEPVEDRDKGSFTCSC